MTRAEVEGTAEQLRRAGAELRRRDPETVIEAVCRAFDDLCAPESRLRAAWQSDLPEPSGLHPECIRRGVELALADWNGQTLRAVARDEAAAVSQGGFALTTVVLAGAIPMPNMLQVVLPLLLRSPVLAKASAHDPVTPGLVVKALAKRDPLLGRCLAVAPIARRDEEAMQAALASECVSATGNSQTIASLGARAAAPGSPHQRFVGYGHKLSLALLGAGAVGPDMAAGSARALARDVALWDQLGCLSATSILVAGADGLELAQALARELAALQQVMPRGRVTPQAAAAIRSAREEAGMRGGGSLVLASPGTEWTVVLEGADSPGVAGRLRAGPLHRFVRVVSAPNTEAALGVIAPLRGILSAAALAGFDEGGTAVAETVRALGARRICAPGELQAPPLGWHRDGLPLLAPLSPLPL